MYRWFVVALITGTGAAQAAGTATPRVIACTLSSAGGCGEDGMCMVGPVRQDNFVITFDLARQRFSSPWGRGRITRLWEHHDGTHRMALSSPPAGAELTFSSDWSQGGRDEAGYSCRIVRR